MRRSTPYFKVSDATDEEVGGEEQDGGATDQVDEQPCAE